MEQTNHTSPESDASSSKSEISKPKRGRPKKNVDNNNLARDLSDKLHLEEAYREKNKLEDEYPRASKGEKELYKLLTGLKITYSREVSFDNCRGQRVPLRFDAMIIIKGKVGFIEIDGRQHRELVPDFHKTEEDFKRGQEYDLIKNKFAKAQGCSLLRISDKQEKNQAFYVSELIKRMDTDPSKPHYIFSDPDIYKNPFGEEINSSGNNYCIIQ